MSPISLSLAARNIYSENAPNTGSQQIPFSAGKGPLVVGVDGALWIIAVVVIGMRMYSRKVLTKFYGLDDTFILAAIVFATGDFILKIIWCYGGVGKHIQNVTKDELTLFAKAAYANSILYPWSLGLVKLSILTFYRRIVPSDTFRRVCVVMMGFISCLLLCISLAQAFSCSPPPDSYILVMDPNEHCVNKPALQYAGSVLNLVTDLVVLLLPMKYLWALSLDRYKRYGVIALFSLGLISCIASAFRLSTIYHFYSNEDPSYDAFPIAIWSGIEINLAIITASLAASKPFFHKYFFRHLRRYLPSIMPGSMSSGSRNATTAGNSGEDSANQFTHASHEKYNGLNSVRRPSAGSNQPSWLGQPSYSNQTAAQSDADADADSDHSIELNFHDMMCMMSDKPLNRPMPHRRASDYMRTRQVSLRDILREDMIAEDEPCIESPSTLEMNEGRDKEDIEIDTRWSEKLIRETEEDCDDGR